MDENGIYKRKYLGRFEMDDIEGAFNAYKKCKEDNIKFVANKYKDDIPDKLYQAMINYIVSIDD